VRTQVSATPAPSGPGETTTGSAASCTSSQASARAVRRRPRGETI